MSLGRNLSQFLINYRGANSQEWLAKEIGVSRMTVYRWEKAGAGGATLDELDRIAAKLKLAPARLVGLVNVEPGPSARDLIRALSALDEGQLAHLIEAAKTMAAPGGAVASATGERGQAGKKSK